MDYGDEPPRRRRPPQQKPKGNLRLVVAIMGAVIFGLLIALLVSCGGGETKTVTETTEITREVPAKEKGTEKEAEGSEGEESELEEPSEETGGLGGEEFEGVPEGEIEELAPEEEEIPTEEEPSGGLGTE
ncbi:MAG TPA: hypothetical protein VMF55_01440 [Solirubrobacterales bacterium]|nr:hypothetical protein [Solirubrobacterales bacterium]